MNEDPSVLRLWLDFADAVRAICATQDYDLVPCNDGTTTFGFSVLSRGSPLLKVTHEGLCELSIETPIMGLEQASIKEVHQDTQSRIRFYYRRQWLTAEEFANRLLP